MIRMPRSVERYERETVVSAFEPNHTIMLDVNIRGQSLIRIEKKSLPTPACHKLVTRDGINKSEIALGKFVMIVKNAIPTVWKPTPINPLSKPAINIALKIDKVVITSNTF